jgi:hypothetical protein
MFRLPFIHPQYQMVMVGHYRVSGNINGKYGVQLSQALYHPCLAVFVVVTG